jgi:hypothetical protein
MAPDKGGTDVEHARLTWRKSSRSGQGDNGACVEVARLPHSTHVRDSKNPSAGTLSFPSGSFVAFLGVVQIASSGQG